jgi:Rieske Fe-S protein
LKIEDGKLICPKHDSPFDNEGVPLPKTADGEDTPAKKPLPRYAIAVDDKGRVIVDTSKTFEKDKWEDPAAFVEAEKK